MSGLIAFYSPENCQNASTWCEADPERDCAECDHFVPYLTHRDLQDQAEIALEDCIQDEIHSGMEE